MGGGERRLFYIAHAFAPAGGPGSQRATKFSKFLPRLGWRITVLTTQPDLYRRTHGLHDPLLLEEVPPEVEVLRVSSPEAEVAPPRRIGIPGLDRLRFMIWRRRMGPDATSYWCRRAYPVALRAARKRKACLVMASGGPFSTFLLARRLARRLRVPCVLDFRDPWYEPDWEENRETDERHRCWEQRVLAGAARASFVTDGMYRHYTAAYPERADRFALIRNGVDLEEPWRRDSAEPRRDLFEIVFTGRFLARTDPGPFLEALALARARSRAFAARARFVVVGRIGEPEKMARANRAVVARLGLAEIVEERGYLPHVETVRLQRSAGVLFVSLAGSRIAVACKSYEYLAAKRPILAMVPREGENAEILGRSPLTIFASREGPEDAAAKLLDFFGRWERGELFDLPAPEVPEEYTRAFQARQLSALLNEALTGET